jgi:hypothetical protein
MIGTRIQILKSLETEMWRERMRMIQNQNDLEKERKMQIQNQNDLGIET